MNEFIDNHFITLFPIFFIVLWVSVSLLISLTGGWFHLRKKFATKEKFSGKKWHMQTIFLNWARYRSVTVIGANTSHLYLSVIFLFKIGHPNLMIPWSEIHAEEEKGVFSPHVKLHFNSVPSVALKLSKSQADNLESASNGVWSYTKL